MSRLFTARASSLDIAAAFDVAGEPIVPVPTEMVEGDIGPIVIENNGRSLLRLARWGFPRMTKEAWVRNEGPG